MVTIEQIESYEARIKEIIAKHKFEGISLLKHYDEGEQLTKAIRVNQTSKLTKEQVEAIEEGIEGGKYVVDPEVEQSIDVSVREFDRSNPVERLINLVDVWNQLSPTLYHYLGGESRDEYLVSYSPVSADDKGTMEDLAEKFGKMLQNVETKKEFIKTKPVQETIDVSINNILKTIGSLGKQVDDLLAEEEITAMEDEDAKSVDSDATAVTPTRIWPSDNLEELLKSVPSLNKFEELVKYMREQLLNDDSKMRRKELVRILKKEEDPGSITTLHEDLIKHINRKLAESLAELPRKEPIVRFHKLADVAAAAVEPGATVDAKREEEAQTRRTP